MAKTPEGAARLAVEYREKIVPALIKQYGYTSPLAVPRMEKIVLNVGCGEAAQDAKLLEEAQRDMGLLTGQRPVVTRAKKAISNFKIRKKDPVGCKVTLRQRRMYEFLDRLIHVVLPRIRDFRGLPNRGFDRTGNYSFGIQEQTIFPELRAEQSHYGLGMDVVVVTTARSAKDARALLEAFGWPLEK